MKTFKHVNQKGAPQRLEALNVMHESWASFVRLSTGASRVLLPSRCVLVRYGTQRRLYDIHAEA